jgi:hypothetical protein
MAAVAYAAQPRSSTSGRARRVASHNAMTTTATAPMNHGSSRNEKSVPSKSTPVSAAASPPVSATGISGRIPIAAAMPAAWRRSRMKSMPEAVR